MWRRENVSNGRIGRVTELKIGTFRISIPTTLFSQDKEGALARGPTRW